MASLGHVLLGFAAARVERRRGRPLLESFIASLVLWAGLSLLPDLDVIGFRFGVVYADPWGHRGATHSLVFAALAALVVAGVGRLRRAPFWPTLALAFAVVASHPLLDALTDGGLGVALGWPFTLRRFFAPWTPLPVAPIGKGLWSARGLYVLGVELLVFSPCLAWALLARGKPAPKESAHGRR